MDRVTALRRAASPDARKRRRHEPSEEEQLERLAERLDRLEQQLEALQDSVHRDSRRRDDEIAWLRRAIQPDAMARSLSDDARRRGL